MVTVRQGTTHAGVLLALFVGVFLGRAAQNLPSGALDVIDVGTGIAIALLVAILFRRTLRRRMEEAARQRGRRRRRSG